MTWLRKLRPVLIVLGGLLLVGGLLGARHLTHGAGGGTDAPASPPTNGKAGTGPFVIGWVDSDPSPVYPGLPPHLPSGEVAAVFVKVGDEVKVNDPLYKFNSAIPEKKLDEARLAVVEARANVRKAKALQDQHKTTIETQKLKLKAVELEVNRTQEGYHLYEANFRETNKNATPERLKVLLANDAERFKLETAYLTAQERRNAEAAALTALETADVGAAVAIAEAAVKRYEAVVGEATTTIDLCTVRAKVAGTIEEVNVSPGTQMGVSTRTPAVVLVPAGPRVIRAEVEADFAHKVGSDRIGKEVTIYDNTDPKITYKGTVRRVGGTFLPKRTSSDGFIPSETRVLQATIDVTDPAPAGKSPLRVGQKVRVNLGQ